MSPLATIGKRKVEFFIDGRRPYLYIGVAAGDHWETDVVWLIDGRRPWLGIGVAAGEIWND